MSLSESVRTSVESAVRAEPIDGVLLLQRVTARRSRARWSTAGLALASVTAVLAVAVGVPLLIGEPAQEVALTPATVPPGQQAVSWHGVQVFVPEGWRIGDLRCHEPQSDTVIVPGARDDCGTALVPGLTVVEFTAGADSVAGSREVEVSGQSGRRGTVPLTEEPGVLAVLVLPDLDVTVSVRSPDAGTAEALLDTAQVVEVDARGCASTLPATTPSAPDVVGASERVLPGDPVRVILCEYGDLRLERSGTLPAEQVRAFQAALDAASVGTSPSRSGISVLPEVCPDYDRAPLVVQAEYADGSRLQIFTRLNSCTGPDPTNGARQVVVDPDVLTPLYRALYGW